MAQEKLVVFKHTLPIFIPIKNIEVEFLNKNCKVLFNFLYFLFFFKKTKKLINFENIGIFYNY